MEPGTYVLKDNCGNAIDVVAGGKIGKISIIKLKNKDNNVPL